MDERQALLVPRPSEFMGDLTLVTMLRVQSTRINLALGGEPGNEPRENEKLYSYFVGPD